MKDWAIANGESRRAEQILDQGNFKIPARESVLVQSKTVTVDEPAFAAAVGSVVLTLSHEPNVTNIVSPIDHPQAGLVSRDRHSALVQFDVKGKAEDAKDKIAPILAAIDGAQSGNPSVIIEEFGQASADYQVTQRFGERHASRRDNVAAAHGRNPGRRLRGARRRRACRCCSRFPPSWPRQG